MTDPFWPMSEEELAAQEEVVLESSEHEAPAPVEEKSGTNPGQYVAVVGLTASDNNNNQNHKTKTQQSSSVGDRKVRFDTDKGEDDDDDVVRGAAGHVTVNGNVMYVTSQPVQQHASPGAVYVVSSEQTASYAAGATVLALDGRGGEHVVTTSPEWVHVAQEQAAPGTEWLHVEQDPLTGEYVPVQAQPTWVMETHVPMTQHVQPALMHHAAAPGTYDVSQTFSLQAVGADVEEEYVIVVTDDEDDAGLEKQSSGCCC